MNGKRCKEMVRYDAWHRHPCGKPAKYHEDHKYYCGIHAPSKCKEREEKRENNPVRIKEAIKKLEREIRWRQNALGLLQAKLNKIEVSGGTQ